MAIESRPNSIECPKWEAASLGAKRCKFYEGDTHQCAHDLIGGTECSEYTKLRKKSEAASLLKSQTFAGATVTPGGPAQPALPGVGAVEAGAHSGGGLGVVGNSGGLTKALGALNVNSQLAARRSNSNSNSSFGATPRAKPEAGGSGSNSSSGSRPVHRIIQNAIELGFIPPPDFQPAKEIDPRSIEALEGAVDEIVMRSQSMGDKEIVLVKEVKKDDPRLQISFRDAATIRLLVDCFPGAQIIDVRRVGEEREIPF